MATGIARGAKARGKRIAFGDREKIRWHPYAREIFRNNPNIAPPGDEDAPDIEWVEHYAGKRLYNRQFGKRWLWMPGHGNRPGEVFFDADELKFGKRFGAGFVLIEPNVPTFKSVAPNKQWPLDRYDKLAKYLRKDGYDVCQFLYGSGHQIPGVRQIKTPSFRHAMAVLAHAALYIGPEGGLHHGAAAVGIPAVVIFGGFITPDATGYLTHTNLTAGGDACGSLQRCEHCRLAMDAITIEHVHGAAADHLKRADGQRP